MNQNHTLTIPACPLTNCDQTHAQAIVTGLIDSLKYQVGVWGKDNPATFAQHGIFQALTTRIQNSNKQYRPTDTGAIYPCYTFKYACVLLGMLTQVGELMGGYVASTAMLAAHERIPSVGMQGFLEFFNRNRNVGGILRSMVGVGNTLLTVSLNARMEYLAEMSAPRIIGYSDLHMRAYISTIGDTLDSGVEFTQDELKCVLVELLADKFGSTEIPEIILRPHGQLTASEMIRRMQNRVAKTKITDGPLRSLCEAQFKLDDTSDWFISLTQTARSPVNIAGVVRRPMYWLKLYANSFAVCESYKDDNKPSVDDLYACVGLSMLRAYDQMVLSEK